MKLAVLICLTAASLLQVDAIVPAPTAKYMNSKVLVADTYLFYWNFTAKEIIGEVHLKHNAFIMTWIAFGLTPNGGMDGSDVFVAWLNTTSGKIVFKDRNIRGRNVLIDKQQDWSLLTLTRLGDYTAIKFSREIRTCDANNEDINIETGTQKIIYAWGTSFTSTGDIAYHGYDSRGSASVQLISSLNQKAAFDPSEPITTYDFTVNTTLPDGLDTYYHCHMFKVPNDVLMTKQHLLRISTLVQPGNEKNVHHWLIHQCNRKFEEEYLAKNPFPQPGHCFDEIFTYSNNAKNTWNNVYQYCRTVTGVWAIGGELIQDFPQGTGFPIGGANSESSYFYIQMHYDNPILQKNLRDTSGIRYHLTKNLRKNEIGVMTVGGAASWVSLLIPPGVDNFKLDFHCRKDCLNDWYNGSTITVFATAPHTHLTGTQVTTTIVNNGKEIGYLQKSLNYDFNYQYINYFNTPVVLKPGDELRTTCTYRTLNRKNYTFGGLGTFEEMW